MCASINQSPNISLLSFISPYKAISYVPFSLFYFKLHRYLYNYLAIIFSDFLVCVSFEINLTCIQFSHICNMSRYCKNSYSSNIDTFFENIQWVAIISHKFLILTQIKVIHSICSQSFQSMTLIAFKQLAMYCFHYIRSLAL